jgi:phosphoribosylcarboxyaminoimidazole (NCAIR) mutase
VNAGLLAAAILALSDEDVRKQLRAFREGQTATVLENQDLG